MKLIIDIDEDTYKDIKRGKVYSSVRDVPQESVLAIANGTPLDKIRDEIQKVLDAERDFTSDNAKAQAIALSWCLEIIDRYTKGENG